MNIEEILSQLINSKNREEKINAMSNIILYLNPATKLGDTSFLPYILEFLTDQDDFVRIKATEAAEYYRDESVIDRLVNCLKNDSNYFVRGFAAKALGGIGNIRAKQYLEEAVNDPEGFVVSFAAQSLKTINIKASFSSKLEMLKNKMKDNKKEQ